MGFMRLTHFIFMWIFTTNFMLRVYWAFFGKGGDWRKYIAQRWFNGKVLKATGRHYLMYDHWPEGMQDRILQNTTYLFLAVLYIVQILTGLALFYNASGSIAFVGNILGGLQAVRQLHLFLMWFFIMFTVIHFYMGASEEWDKIKLMFFGVADER
jgi:Ni/Fe-hydrogenase 1 B-type cytochrome subunit